MNWEITGAPSTGDGRATPPARRPRHRSAGDPVADHWWRPAPPDPNAIASAETEAISQSALRARSTSQPPPPPQTGTGRQVLFPGTGSIRAAVGTWTVLADDAAGRTTRHPHPGYPEPGADDASTVRITALRTRGAVAGAGPDADARALATVFPRPDRTGETGWRAYREHTKILTGRQLLVWVRDRTTLLQTLFFPAMSMIMFKVVLGDAIGKATGQNSAFGTVPLVVLVGAMFGSLAGGVRLQSERKTGLLTRLYALPVHRGADLSARIITELARIMLGTIILTAFGTIIGWRFNQGILASLGIFAVALLFGAAFSTMVLALSLSSSGLPLVPIVSLISSLFMFFNSGFSPVSAYPKVLQPVVANQPMTCAIDAMRALAIGGDLGSSLWKTFAWAIGALILFSYPALRGYRKAAASR